MARHLTVPLLLGLLGGCSTVVPLQTASTVSPGAYRLGGQLSASPWCGLSLDRQNCAFGLRGGVPLPELRLNARHGVNERFDLGASVHGTGVLGWGYRLGLFVDGKVELFSWVRGPEGEGEGVPPPRGIVSVGPGIGYLAEHVSTSVTGLGQLDLALPLRLGIQTRRFELVTGFTLIERLQFRGSASGEGTRELFADTQLSLSVGAFLRGRFQLGVALTYLAPATLPAGGLFTLSVGSTYDVLPE